MKIAAFHVAQLCDTKETIEQVIPIFDKYLLQIARLSLSSQKSGVRMNNFDVHIKNSGVGE
ncbi:MAG: hypothetical protein WBA93_21175 [Microcoleaceae cyanobacterium]